MTSSAPMIAVAGRGVYPATLSTRVAAEWLGCSPDRLQAERGRGTLPVEPLSLGHRLRWPTLLVAQALGLPVEIVHPSDADAAATLPGAAEPQVTGVSSGRAPDGVGR